jgi:hypothetical protein
MGDPLRGPGSSSGRVRAERGPPRMPRWVKVLLAIVILLIAAFVISRLAGVEHGPGLHRRQPASIAVKGP